MAKLLKNPQPTYNLSLKSTHTMIFIIKTLITAEFCNKTQLREVVNI